MEINFNLHPREGYCYFDLDGAKLVASSWRELAEKLLLWKRRHGEQITYEEAIRLINEQVCQRDPVLCPGLREKLYAYTTQRSADGPRVTLRPQSRALVWLSRVIGRFQRAAPFKVSEELAEERSARCFECPMHKWYNLSCTGCSSQLDVLRKAALPDTPIKTKLGWCEYFGMDVAVAVHLAEKELGVEEELQKKALDKCWLKREF